MLGSLMVHAEPMTSPRASATTRAEPPEALDRDVALPATLCGEPQRRREVVERDDRLDTALRAARRTDDGSGPTRRGRIRPPPVRCGSIRPRSGSCRTPGRPRGRRPPPSAPTSRSSRPRAPRSPTPACARRPTSRCWCCRPRPGAPPSQCPTGNPAGRSVPVEFPSSTQPPACRGFPAARYRSLTMTSPSSPMTDVPDSEHVGAAARRRQGRTRLPRARWSRHTGW